jgi:ribonuclease HI
MSQNKVWVYTDGSCAGNPGPGGWAFILKDEARCQEVSGYEEQTTNNRMELTAAIKGLESVLEQKITFCSVTVVSDSQYVVKGITQWIHQWQRNQWRTSQKKPVENKDLWEALWILTERLSQVSWQWVRGHSGHAENDAVDRLAQSAIATYRKER